MLSMWFLTVAGIALLVAFGIGGCLREVAVAAAFLAPYLRVNSSIEDR